MKFKKFTVLFLFISIVLPDMSLSAASPNPPGSLKTEYCVNPIGIDTAAPRLSWVFSDPDRGEKQTAYRIIVASSETNINNNTGNMWDSGKVSSDMQNGVKYAGAALSSRTPYWWKVMVWDRDGNQSTFSSIASFETGMLNQSDWSASSWIGGDYTLLRDDFILDSSKTIARARLYVTSMGFNEVYFNGQKAGRDVLNPAYTEYDRRVLYSTYDIKGLLSSTNNAIGIMLGRSYYQRFISGTLGVRAEIHIVYTDGTVWHYGTNAGYFKAINGGPVTYNDIYNGESYDATRELPGWSNYGYNDSGWPAPSILSYSGSISAAYQAIRVTEEITPVSITRVQAGQSGGPDGFVWCSNEGGSVTFPQAVNVAFGANGSFYYLYNVSGTITFDNNTFGDPIPGVQKAGYYQYANGATPVTYRVDMGVNFAGWARITVSGNAGTMITMRFAEYLNPDGTLDIVDLRGARQTDTYIMKGGGTEVWEPRFTYHGFRYVEVTGFPAAPTASTIKGRVVHSDYARESSFNCSNTLINNIYKAYLRSQRSNTMGIPTDCPSRDERMGAGADAFLTAEAAILAFDMITFYENCFQDVDDAEESTGEVQDVFPSYSWPRLSDTPWMSQRILMPWELYMATGDKSILSKYYNNMKLAVNYLQSLAGSDYLGTPAANGDWVPSGSTESNVFFADAYFYRNAVLMAKIAGELGNTADQATYNALAVNIQNAFNNTYFNANSYYGSNTQAGNAVALEFGLVPESSRNAVFNSLLNNISANSNHITAGILGTKAIMQVLWEENRSDIAFALMNQTSYPSWGYMYNKGPGTLWERWNSDTAIGSGMNSFNHVMFGGGPGIWAYKGIAGISPLKPGYSEVLIRPEIVGDLTGGSGSVMTPRGYVTTGWTKVSGSQVNLTVTIPGNSNAIIHVPTLGSTTVRIRESGTEIYNNGMTGSVPGVAGLRATLPGSIAFIVGSGTYSFVMTTDGTPRSATPAGFTFCANEGESYPLSGVCDVAFGADGLYYFLSSRSGTITFDNATFGGDPVYGVQKAGYYKSAGATVTPASTPTPTSTPAFTSTTTSTGTPTGTPTPTQGNLIDITNLGGAISAQYTDSPSGEDITKLTDNSSSTKYLTFHASGWVQFQSNASYVVTGYAITSANDAAERDPMSWTFQGSTNGSAWTTLDSRSGEDFPERFQRKSYLFSNSSSYNYYRLNLTNNSGTILQLSEWEILGTSGTTNTPTAVVTATPTRTPTWTPTHTFTATSTQAATATPAPTQGSFADITNLGGTVSAQYTDSPSGEDIAKLIDNSSSTKYLTFHASGWVQFQANASCVVTGYTITSANDYAERDPLAWTFQGSTNGSTWTTLDSRSGEDFPDRFQLKSYTFANTASFNYYRLNMTNNSGTILQLAEWEIFGTAGTVNTPTPSPTSTVTAASTVTQAATATSTPTPSSIAAAFSDNFNDNSIESAWTLYGGTWSEREAILRQDSTSQGDPCKAIVSNSGMSPGNNQTVIARVYVNTWSDGDSARAGVSLFTGTGDGRGYNLLFHNNHSTVQWLDDAVAWGTSYTFNWSNQTWYWFKLKMENGTLYGKVWQDGSAEPSNWPYTWTRSGRSGYPALNGGTSGHGGSCTVFFDDLTVSSP
ncbi:MAG: family 78 glycoside hydrolase catalytic domain [Spirochaetales bacterium]|nr:family 78 glycoside hydrolase catalytic domain [Spirochaetales bacterium]